MTVTVKKKGDSLAAALERAHAVAPKLAQATDKLNASLTSVERAIAELSLGVRAEVDLSSDEDGSYQRLVFSKDGKSWRLFVREGHVIDPHPDEYTPLLNASRETRLTAVGKLKDLVDALVAAAEEECKRVEAKAAEADTIANNLMGLPF